MRVTLKYVVMLITCGLLSDAVMSANILLLPVNHGSHVNFMASVGGALKDVGHDVYAITSPRHAKIVEGYGINCMQITNFSADINIIQEQMLNPNSSMLQAMKIMFPALKNYVRDVFRDSDIMNKLQTVKFDLAIVDGFDVARHLYLIPYKFSIPYISLNGRSDPWTSRVSANPSVEGFFPAMVLSEDSTILHRAANTAIYLLSTLIQPQSYISPINDDSMFLDLVPEKENVGVHELYLRSEMVLINMDIICLETPRVSSPYYQYVGGIAAKPAKALPPDMEKFVSSAKHGVIVMSFGSGVSSIPDDILTKMLSAFGNVKQHVLMRHSGDIPKNKPSNVFMSKWLPQNDLLGHPKTKVFITHSGNNGQLEAVYHGIPLLSMPLFGDQPYNAWRTEVKGFGKTLNPFDFTAQELQEMINELIENELYFNNIQKCSKILKSLPAAQESIVFWVEHILKFGGSHLQPYYLRMPLWKFLLLDVILLYVFISVACVWLLRICCRKCCCKKDLHHQKMD